MFKKKYEEISEKLDKLLSVENYPKEEICYIHNCLKDIERTNDRCESTIKSQQHSIEELTTTVKQLTNALRDKYEHGLFIFSEDCKIPMVIRNGKEITNNMTESFSIEWASGEVPRIDIIQVAGTGSYTED